MTLSAGVITWTTSPFKFQADMGVLLAFMSIWNMAGAAILIPALSHFLLAGPRQLSEAEAARPLLEEGVIPAQRHQAIQAIPSLTLRRVNR